MDVLTGTFVQQGSPAFFLLLVVAAVVALVIWKKMDKVGFNKNLADLIAYKERVEAQIAKSGPEALANLKADLAKVQAKIDALGK